MLCLSAGEISKPNTPAKPLPTNAGDEAITRLDKLRNANGNMRTAEIRRNMQVRVLWVSCLLCSLCMYMINQAFDFLDILYLSMYACTHGHRLRRQLPPLLTYGHTRMTHCPCCLGVTCVIFLCVFVLQRVMQNDAAVFRTGETLQEGCQKIDETVASFGDVKVG